MSQEAGASTRTIAAVGTPGRWSRLRRSLTSGPAVLVLSIVVFLVGLVLGLIAMWLAQASPPFPETVGRLADAVQVVGLFVAIVSAGVASLIAVVQMGDSRRVQQEMNTRRMWADYLQMAHEAPQLADGTVTKTDRSKYEWFVAFMLMACEQVLDSFPDDPAWRDVVLAQLKRHQAELKTYPPDKRAMYSTQLRELWEESLQGSVQPAPARMPSS